MEIQYTSYDSPTVGAEDEECKSATDEVEERSRKRRYTETQNITMLQLQIGTYNHVDDLVELKQ